MCVAVCVAVCFFIFSKRGRHCSVHKLMCVAVCVAVCFAVCVAVRVAVYSPRSRNTTFDFKGTKKVRHFLYIALDVLRVADGKI